MRILKRIGIVFGVLLALLIVIGLILPGQIEVERSVAVRAPADRVYPLISDFKSGWSQWNTFDDEDPDIQYTYPGATAGVGAIQSWTSQKMGDGKMTLTKADPMAGIEYELLIGPDQFHLTGSMQMAPQDGGTRLTWRDTFDVGGNPFKRLMGPVIAT